MPRDVTTRWNSTYDMVEFAVKYRAAIDAMTAARDLDLRKYELIPEEWEIAKELRDVLKVGGLIFLHSYYGYNELSQVFKDATLYFSRGTPNLATVIPAMDHIDKFLATSADNSSKFSPAIRAALAIGKTAMNKYYNLTDQSEVYRIAMGMWRRILRYQLLMPRFQFSTHATNLSTSRNTIGKRRGLIPPIKSFVMNSTGRILL
jgi:hypothetical protein